MDVDYLAAITTNAERIAAAADRSPATRVPSCPDWNLAELAGHQGWVFRMATAALTSTGKPDLAAVPSAPPGQETEFLRDAVAPLLAAIRSTSPDEPCWNFSGQNQVAGFWGRRQANESLIHRWDAENALGTATDLPVAEAVDGIDEWFAVYLPMRFRKVDPTPIAGSIHLHCTDGTDGAGEWTLIVADGAIRVERGHAKGDVAARGPAPRLLLMIWGRVATDDPSLEIFGDGGVLDRWLGLIR